MEIAMRLPCLLLALLPALPLGGMDITTLDGRTFTPTDAIKDRPDGIAFTTADGPTRLPWRALPPDIRAQHHYDPISGAIVAARGLGAVTNLEMESFRLSQLDRAKAKARAEGKPIGAILVWHSLFGHPVSNMAGDSATALAHFIKVWRNAVVLVFVFHENEKDKVPPAIGAGINGPDEGGFSPSMAITDSDCAH